ncbi:MAG: hypothetical protein U0031_11965 [Thermomicrobiales bacterium]
MVWKRLFGKDKPAPPVPGVEDSGPVARQRPVAADPAMQTRLDQLLRRREMALYDLERAETANHPENPWRERMALLDRSLASIEDDLRAIDAAPAVPGLPLPATPITDLTIDLAEPASLSFAIGPERFEFAEEPDWDERGGPVVRGDLRQRSGDVRALARDSVPADRRAALIRHLEGSITAFAIDMRDRALEGEPLPVAATLADLAQPCPECGDWRDWRGHCATCAARAWQRQNLRAEAVRLAQERDDEESDRAKWAERLPVARRRLADIDAEIQQLRRPS